LAVGCDWFVVGMRNNLGYLRHRSVNWLCLETVFVISLVVNWVFVIMGRKIDRYVAGRHVVVLSLGVSLTLSLSLSLKARGAELRVKVNPEQATKTQRRSRCIALLFL